MTDPVHEPDEGFSLRDLAAAAQAFRTYGAFGKSMEWMRRLSGTTAGDLSLAMRCILDTQPALEQLMHDAGVDPEIAALKLRVAWVQTHGLPTW
jgi:hypothetical protein